MFVGSATGEVVGYSRNREFLRIVRDGNVTTVSYHPNFWMPLEVTYPCCGEKGSASNVDECLGCLGSFCDRCMVTHECGEVRRVG